MKTYKVLDIFSYLHTELMSLEQLEAIFNNGIDNTDHHVDGYTVQKYTPDDIMDDIVRQLAEDLIGEGRKVAFIKRDDRIIAAIGYWHRNPS